MKAFLLLPIGLILLCCCIIPQAKATTTVSAANCSQQAVQDAINSAINNDTVLIPSGSCTWTSTVTINKGIILQGSGQDSTIINSASTRLLAIMGANSNFRLTGISFTGSVGSYMGLIDIDGTFSTLRIDHLKFTNIDKRTFLIGYNSQFQYPAIRGVFDHITYSNTLCYQFMLQYGYDGSWNFPDDYGSDNAIYIEDSNFSWPGSVNGCGIVDDGEHGARFVIRSNTITSSGLGWHDTGGTPAARGTRFFEIYNNTFICPVSDCGWGAIGFRGGIGVVYNNIIPVYPNGWENPSDTEIKRLDTTMSMGKPWINTLCDNITDRVCSDFRSHCSAGDNRACSGDYDCTSVGAGTCSVDACTLDSECGTGNTCLAKFDGQLDSYGWPCRDQTGRGQDDSITHEQASSPLYWWNNIDSNKKCTDRLRHCAGGSHNACWGDSDCPGIGPCLNSCNTNNDCPVGMSCTNNNLSVYVAPANANYIKLNRDYCNHDTTTACSNVSGWTYTPYTYPHRLRLESYQNCSQLGGSFCCPSGQVCSGGYSTSSTDCSSCCVGGTCRTPSCGDGFCDPGETCPIENCCNGQVYSPGTQECCSGSVYTGNCCSDSNCTSPKTCINHVCTQLCDNLALLMHFDNQAQYGESATNIYDFSGNGNNASCSGSACPTYTSSGKFSGAYQFDGSNDFASVPVASGSTLDIDSNPVTMVAWIKPNTVITQQAIVSRGLSDGVAAGKDGYGFWINSSGKINLGSFGGGNFDGNSTLSANTWSHVAAVINGASSALYLNGADNTPASHTVSVVASNQPLKIGASRNLTDTADVRFFSGTIDELAIWNRSLSSSEIQSLYSSSQPISCGASCIHKSDNNPCDGCVDMTELSAFINRWNINNLDVTMKELMEAIGLWNMGCG